MRGDVARSRLSGPIAKAQCTTSAYRRISRWEHEDVLEVVQARLDAAPEAARLRRQTVEHPFGTLKAWMGSTHFLAYNPKRAMKVLGVGPLIEATSA